MPSVIWHDVLPFSLERLGRKTQKLLRMEANEIRSFQNSRILEDYKPWVSTAATVHSARHGATLFAKIEQRRLRQCSSCCAVGKVCTLPTIIDSLDSNARLPRHRVCSLQSAIVLRESLPLVTFILKRCHTGCQQRISEPVSNRIWGQ